MSFKKPKKCKVSNDTKSLLRTLKIDTIEGHRLRRLVDRPELQKREILVQIDLTRQHRIPRGLSQPAQVHLLIEELHHLLLRHAERYVPDVQPSCLTGDGRTHDGNGRLRGVGDNVRGYLTGGLHRLVLERSDVLEAGRRHVPVEGGFAASRMAALVAAAAARNREVEMDAQVESELLKTYWEKSIRSKLSYMKRMWKFLLKGVQ